jgi:hypothetical protein
MTEARDKDLKLYYYAANQIVKVRVIMVFSLLCGVGFFLFAWMLAGSAESDKPDFIELIFLSAVLLLVSIGFPLLIWIYAGCYVESIEVDNQQRNSIYHTLTLFGTRAHTVHASQIESREANAGRLSYTGSADGPVVPKVNAPWTSVRVRGRRLPFIIDGRGFYVHWKKNGEFELKKAF